MHFLLIKGFQFPVKCIFSLLKNIMKCYWYKYENNLTFSFSDTRSVKLVAFSVDQAVIIHLMYTYILHWIQCPAWRSLANGTREFNMAREKKCIQKEKIRELCTHIIHIKNINELVWTPYKTILTFIYWMFFTDFIRFQKCFV